MQNLEAINHRVCPTMPIADLPAIAGGQVTGYIPKR